MNKTKQFEWLKTIGMATVGLLMIAAEAVQAADNPVRICEAAKIGAAGVRSLCLTTEQAKARLGKSSNPAKCETQFDQAIANIDAKAANHACRYVNNADGTISDLNTLLQWEKKTTDGSVHDVSNLYTWSARAPCPDVLFEAGCLNEPQLYLSTGTAFTKFLAMLNHCMSTQDETQTPGPLTGGFAGHCDWRLPSIFELRSILLTQCTQSPCIAPVFGPTNITPNGDGYLTSTSASSDLPHRYWYLNFDYNPINLIGTTYKDASNTPARAVRGGR